MEYLRALNDSDEKNLSEIYIKIKMKCFLFDIDGTLTKPRQPMDSEFGELV